MSAITKTLIRRFGEELWNQGNLLRADEFLAPDVISHFTHLPSPTNRAGFLTFVTQLRAAFPDLAHRDGSARLPPRTHLHRSGRMIRLA